MFRPFHRDSWILDGIRQIELCESGPPQTQTLDALKYDYELKFLAKFVLKRKPALQIFLVYCGTHGTPCCVLYKYYEVESER